MVRASPAWPYYLPGMMRRSIRRRLLWLLPLALARLLLPAGVMPGSDAHGAAFVMCSVHHAAGPHGDHAGAGSGDPQAHRVCPFAVAGTVAPVCVPALIPGQARPVAFASVSITGQRSPGAGPPRSQGPRAPPSFS